jgi:hypothetical protein
MNQMQPKPPLKPIQIPQLQKTIAEEQGAEETSTESADEEEVTEPEELAPKEPATPSDEELFIEVIDADGVTHKISKIEDLPADFRDEEQPARFGDLT